jgi:hypothetical protein
MRTRQQQNERAYVRSFTFTTLDLWLVIAIFVVFIVEVALLLTHWHNTQNIKPRPSVAPIWLFIPTLSTTAIATRISSRYFKVVRIHEIKAIIKQRLLVGPCCGMPLRRSAQHQAQPIDKSVEAMCTECGRLWKPAEVRAIWSSLIRRLTSGGNVLHELFLWLMLALLLTRSLW